MAGHKLNYRIKGRRPLNVSGVSHQPGCPSMPDQLMDMVDVEWTHTDGFKPDTQQFPFRYTNIDAIITPLLSEAVFLSIIDREQSAKIVALSREVFKKHPSSDEFGILTVEIETRQVVGDQVNVRSDMPDSIVMQILEEKRPILARALGVEP